MADDQKPQDQVSPLDQTTPPADIGQQPVDTWPNSTNLANPDSSADSPPVNLANDQQATQSAESVIPEPPKEESPPQAPSPEIGQVNDSSASANLANPSPPVVSPSTPVSSADIPATSSPSPVSPTLPLSPPDISPSVPIPETSPAEVTQSEPPEAAKPPEEKVDTNIQSSDNQGPQAQPDAPKDTPTIDTEKLPEDLANFKSEPLESPQVAPVANLPAETLVKEDTDSGDSPQKSFGDLLSSENQTPPNPSTPSIPSIPSAPSSPIPSTPSAPSISFGDLIKDIEITPPSIPEAQRPIGQQMPTSPSAPPIPSIPPISSFPSSPPFPLPAEALAKAGTSPSSFDVSSRRQKANQVRSQKKESHLNKIIELVRNTKTITNTDVQRLLHVSQSTATNYLAELSRRSLLKRQGIRGGAKYTL